MLFTALARAAELHLSEFSTQNLANTAWVFGAMTLPHEKLFMALARAIEQQGSEFERRNLANTALAFASVSRPDGKLFTALAKAAEQRMNRTVAERHTTSPTRHGHLQL